MWTFRRKEGLGGGGAVLPKRPVDDKRGTLEYVDGPLDGVGVQF